jgi:hypothetical protein
LNAFVAMNFRIGENCAFHLPCGNGRGNNPALMRADNGLCCKGKMNSLPIAGVLRGGSKHADETARVRS